MPQDAHLDELLLSPEKKRYVIFPIQHPGLWERHKKQEAAEWKAGEVDLSHDLGDWSNLTDDERFFLKHVLAFFAASDGVVNENLCERFTREVQILEAKFFYTLQMKMENVHSEMYSRLIDTYVHDLPEKTRLLRGIETIPCVKRKAAWAIRWIESEEASFATRLLAFAVVEGIFFSGSFCAIFWLKKRGLMPGLCHANELIARDEGMHQEFAVYLYTEMLAHKLEEADVHALVDEAVDVEVNFCTEALPVSLIGMNREDMATYIRFVADRLLTQLGVSKLYNVANPFDWMALISLEGKTNFFERRVSEYQMAGVKMEGAHEFSKEADF
jgi:ribonucleoside-diphosphate reductase beta chain